ncbi:MAG: hypothetical protein IKY65_04745 [Rikenellaceae bacterium]|nr:hypothetical protein [Rikenellaceae bacterium]
MGILLLIFGLLTGTALCALVGILGSRRRLGFGWTFVISLVFTPLIGLIAALISDPLPEGEKRWGCLATVVGILTLALIAFFLVLIFGTGAAIFAL